MERRSFATFMKVWPEKRAIVTSPQVSFDEYLERYSNDVLSTDDVVSIMVGDLQRVKLYAEKGFQIPQDIPGDVWEAYEALVAAGYDTRLVPREEWRPTVVIPSTSGTHSRADAEALTALARALEGHVGLPGRVAGELGSGADVFRRGP